MREIALSAIICALLISLNISEAKVSEVESKTGGAQAEAMLGVLDACKDPAYPPTIKQCQREECVKVMPKMKAQLCYISGGHGKF